MNLATPAQRRIFWIRTVFIVLLILLGLWIASSFLPSLAWAVVIAIAIDPLHVRLRTVHGSGRWRLLVALGITVVVALAVLVPLAFGVRQAAIEAAQIAGWINDARNHGVPVPQWLAGLPGVGHWLSGWWQANLASPKMASRQLHDVFAALDLFTPTRLIGSNILHRLVILAFTLLTLFFLLKDRDTIVSQLRRAGAALLGRDGERIGRQTIQSVRGTIDGLVLVGMGEGAVMTVAYVALGIPHPVLLGVITAVAAMIPFGAALVFVVAALMLLGSGSVGGAVTVIVVGLVVVGIADHFVRPALIGGSTRLPFLWVLIGILGGAEMLGVLGLFVGPAVMAVIVMLWRDLVEDEGAVT